MRATLTAVLTAVLVASLWTSPQTLAFLCSMDGERRAACCCAPEAEPDTRTHSEVQRPVCCAAERTPARVSPAVAPVMNDAAFQLAALGGRHAAQVRQVFATTDFVPRLPRGPPEQRGPPPYVWNCSLLI